MFPYYVAHGDTSLDILSYAYWPFLCLCSDIDIVDGLSINSASASGNYFEAVTHHQWHNIAAMIWSPRATTPFSTLVAQWHFIDLLMDMNAKYARHSSFPVCMHDVRDLCIDINACARHSFLYVCVHEPFINIMSGLESSNAYSKSCTLLPKLQYVALKHVCDESAYLQAKHAALEAEVRMWY